MSSNMFLFWGSGSIPCWKPMIVLEEKGLSGYPNKKITFSEKEHKSEEVMKLNPRGQVPTFKDGDVVVNESGAICFYLEKQHTTMIILGFEGTQFLVNNAAIFHEYISEVANHLCPPTFRFNLEELRLYSRTQNKYSNQGTKLLPEDNAQRGRVLQRIFEASNVDSNLISNIVYYRFRTPKDKLDQELLETRYESLRTELKIWDDYLATSGGFVAGSNFTMADVFFFPYIAFGVRVGLNLSKYSFISAYYDKVKDRPSVKASWPPHWADGPGDSSFLDSV